MQKLAAVIAVLGMSVCAAGQATPSAKKPCENLKAEIAKKLDEKGVKVYTLGVVDKGKEGDGKVVGICDGGTKSIVYSRGGSASAQPEAKKPQ